MSDVFDRLATAERELSELEAACTFAKASVVELNSRPAPRTHQLGTILFLLFIDVAFVFSSFALAWGSLR